MGHCGHVAICSIDIASKRAFVHLLTNCHMYINIYISVTFVYIKTVIQHTTAYTICVTAVIRQIDLKTLLTLCFLCKNAFEIINKSCLINFRFFT